MTKYCPSCKDVINIESDVEICPRCMNDLKSVYELVVELEDLKELINNLVELLCRRAEKGKVCGCELEAVVAELKKIINN